MDEEEEGEAFDPSLNERTTVEPSAGPYLKYWNRKSGSLGRYLLTILYACRLYCNNFGYSVTM